MHPHGPPFSLDAQDERALWPVRSFFNRSCVCAPQYWGARCDSCKWGRTGPACLDRAQPLTRRNILALTSEERSRVVAAIDLAKRAIHPDIVIATQRREGILGPDGQTPQFEDVTVYNLFVWSHYYSVMPTYVGNGTTVGEVDFSHEGPAFLTWHRFHLLQLERDIQTMLGETTFALPFWDFTSGQGCDLCTDDLFGAQHPGDREALSPLSVFSRWRIVCDDIASYNSLGTICNSTEGGPIRRNPGGNVDRPMLMNLPEPEDVRQCLSTERFDTPPFYSTSDGSFRNALEGYAEPNGRYNSSVRTLHNLAHLYFNGTASQTHISPNDPLFVLLHTFTDAIFDEWLRIHNPNTSEFPVEDAPIGHNRAYYMVPFWPPVRNVDMFMTAPENLGYVYEVTWPGRRLSPLEATAVAVLCALVLSAALLGAWTCVHQAKHRTRSDWRPLLADYHQANCYGGDQPREVATD
uniref:5,6-dihydroxyindole-2-carboxylic acid oxidase-like n=1 Tax=Myxine glutinosa TaxID=7769 RepID=UPI00358E80B0